MRRAIAMGAAAGLVLLAIAPPIVPAAGSPAFSQDPDDYLLFDTGDIPADGVPAADGELLTDHGWRAIPSAVFVTAEYDDDGPKFGALSIFSPELGTNIRFDLGPAVSDVTYQADIYDNGDLFAYTNLRFIDSAGRNGGEIAIWTDDRPGRGGSRTHYSVWDGSWHTTAVPRSVGFHTFTIYVQGTRTEFFIDGQLVQTDSAPRGTNMEEAGILSSSQVAAGFNETQEVWFDNIFVWLGSPVERPIAMPEFLLIDEDTFSSGAGAVVEIAEALGVDSSEMINEDIADPGVREPLAIPEGTIIGSGDPAGTDSPLMTGQVGDEGWFTLKTIPTSWEGAGPDDGLRNYLNAAPGLGTGGDPEVLLDKIPDVTPLRTAGLEMLVEKRVCAVVYKSDISINYDPLEGNLQGANLGLVAFEVVGVGAPDGSTLPDVTIQVVDPEETCGGPLELFLDAPTPISSSEPSP